MTPAAGDRRLEFGLFTEFQCPAGMSEATAFDESMAQLRAAEDLGFDAVWLGELHFQKDRSVLASPLVVAAAIDACTRRIKIGIAVQILPLSHPLRLAEDVATVDHLSRGRLDFGVGRSGLPGHYEGFNIPYEESRDRFAETLEVLLKAWTQERFSHEGRYYRFRDVCVTPKPYQQPHPPLRVAATTEETYPMVGRLGYPLFVAVRTSPISDLRRFLGGYHAAWQAAGHPGRGEVALLIPVYVAATERQAREEPQASTLHWFRAIAEALMRSPTRRTEAERLARISWDDILAEQVVYGTPDQVVERLRALRADLGFSSLSVWMNVGGQVEHARVLESMRLFATEVAPRLGWLAARPATRPDRLATRDRPAAPPRRSLEGG